MKKIIVCMLMFALAVAVLFVPSLKVFARQGNTNSAYLDGALCSGSCGISSTSGNAISSAPGVYQCFLTGTLYFKCDGVMDSITRSGNGMGEASLTIYPSCMNNIQQMVCQHHFTAPSGRTTSFQTVD